jgi:transcriptional regulator with XRE-family HTH domain
MCTEGERQVTEQPEERRKRGKGMPKEELETLYPSLSYLSGPPGRATKRAWVAVFNARPDAMHSLLADFIKQVHATPGRIGQRPMPKEEVVDFQGLMYGEANDLPIHEVLPKLVEVSERSFCTAIRMSRTQYQRLIKGEYEPDVNEIRLIARALRRPPTFFVEYRKAMAVAAFLNLLEERPGLATSLYRHYLEVRM